MGQTNHGWHDKGEQTRNRKITTTRYIITNLPKTSDNDKILQAAREKCYIKYRATEMRYRYKQQLTFCQKQFNWKQNEATSLKF